MYGNAKQAKFVVTLTVNGPEGETIVQENYTTDFPGVVVSGLRTAADLVELKTVPPPGEPISKGE